MKSGGVAEFIALHYYDEAYIKSARILADPKTGAVNVRVRFRNFGQHYGLISARVEIRPVGADPRVGPFSRDANNGPTRGSAPTGDPTVAVALKDSGRSISLYAKREDQFAEVATTVKRPALWSPDAPNLYEARVTLLHDGNVADVFQERFGFRSLEVRDRRFYLNGKPIFLRGTNLVGTGIGGRGQESPELMKRYLRDVPALFHGNCLRTHSIPLPVPWLNAADECGAMILQEFPLTVNYETFDYTPEEYARFKAHTEAEYRTMIELYWNHPSIIIWVPTNESPRWEEWENGPLYRLFKEADPSRLVMRAGRVSPGHLRHALLRRLVDRLGRRLRPADDRGRRGRAQEASRCSRTPSTSRTPRNCARTGSSARRSTGWSRRRCRRPSGTCARR